MENSGCASTIQGCVGGCDLNLTYTCHSRASCQLMFSASCQLMFSASCQLMREGSQVDRIDKSTRPGLVACAALRGEVCPCMCSTVWIGAAAA